MSALLKQAVCERDALRQPSEPPHLGLAASLTSWPLDPEQGCPAPTVALSQQLCWVIPLPLASQAISVSQGCPIITQHDTMQQAISLTSALCTRGHVCNVLLLNPLTRQTYHQHKLAMFCRSHGIAETQGLRLDDWLTELQQKERGTVNADFQILKGKGLQALLQRLNTDVPPRRQGMCLPEGQSRLCLTCCIGHHHCLFGLHSQPFWYCVH